MARDWDAQTYHRVSSAMERMATETLDRLALRGDETVLDAGCGSGRVTLRLLERLPRGRVIAVDADEDMVRHASEVLVDDRVDLRRCDLLALDLADEVDAVFSTATFHWILDHDRLFDRLHHALRPGGRLVAQCGGEGNIAGVLTAADDVAGRPEWSVHFRDFSRGSRFAAPGETERALMEVGFTGVRCWLQPFPVVPDEPLAYLETIACGPHVQSVPEARRAEFVEEVARVLGEPVTIDYVRLNLEATKLA